MMKFQEAQLHEFTVIIELETINFIIDGIGNIINCEFN